jgi:SnoaL-like domain
VIGGRDVTAVETGVLLDIEERKRVKARYCRPLDAKDWTAWREIFTDDFVSDASTAGGRVIAGADQFVAFTSRSLRKPSQLTAQMHAPEIEVTSSTTARGVKRVAGSSAHGW